MKKKFIFLLLLLLVGMLTCKVNAEAQSNEKPSLHVFIHVCTINHWQSVLERQLGVIKASGLYDQCNSISLGVLGDGDIKPFIQKYPKVSVLFQNPDLSWYERPTLLSLHQFCMSKPDALVLYLHTKGVSHIPVDPKITDWSRYMEYFVIERWRDCVKALKDHDACGVNWIGNIFFAGNFWWATARYVSTLPPFIESDYTAPETWIGQKSPKVKCFHQSNVHHYEERYPDSNYRNLDKQYFLAATPEGPLGIQLNFYWNKVKKSNLRHPFIMQSPPHCKLTRNFTSNLTKAQFKKVIQDTLNTMKRRKIPRKIHIGRLIQCKPKHEVDYIEVNSQFFMHFTNEFVEKQKLPMSIINGKNQPFRIALRNFKYSSLNKFVRIHKLQKNINLQAPAKWSISIYKLNEEKLDLMASCPVN